MHNEKIFTKFVQINCVTLYYNMPCMLPTTFSPVLHAQFHPLKTLITRAVKKPLLIRIRQLSQILNYAVSISSATFDATTINRPSSIHTRSHSKSLKCLTHVDIFKLKISEKYRRRWDSNAC